MRGLAGHRTGLLYRPGYSSNKASAVLKKKKKKEPGALPSPPSSLQACHPLPRLLPFYLYAGPGLLSPCGLELGSRFRPVPMADSAFSLPPISSSTPRIARFLLPRIPRRRHPSASLARD